MSSSPSPSLPHWLDSIDDALANGRATDAARLIGDAARETGWHAELDERRGRLAWQTAQTIFRLAREEHRAASHATRLPAVSIPGEHELDAGRAWISVDDDGSPRVVARARVIVHALTQGDPLKSSRRAEFAQSPIGTRRLAEIDALLGKEAIRRLHAAPATMAWRRHGSWRERLERARAHLLNDRLFDAFAELHATRKLDFFREEWQDTMGRVFWLASQRDTAFAPEWRLLAGLHWWLSAESSPAHVAARRMVMDEYGMIPWDLLDHWRAPAWPVGRFADKTVALRVEQLRSELVAAGYAESTLREFVSGHYTPGPRWLGCFAMSGCAIAVVFVLGIPALGVVVAWVYTLVLKGLEK